MNASEREHADRRTGNRARLQLRLTVVYPQREGRPYQPIFHGKSHDISDSGLSIVADDNAYHEGEVTVLLTLPPEHTWASPKVITLAARMTYAIRSSKLNAFKIGMTFVAFEQDGRELLEAALQRALVGADVPSTQETSARFRTLQHRNRQLPR